MTLPLRCAEAALNCWINCPGFTPCWPRAGPIGGAGVAVPPGAWSLNCEVISFLAMVSSLQSPAPSRRPALCWRLATENSRLFDDCHVDLPSGSRIGFPGLDHHFVIFLNLDRFRPGFHGTGIGARHGRKQSIDRRCEKEKGEDTNPKR